MDYARTSHKYMLTFEVSVEKKWVDKIGVCGYAKSEKC